MSLCMMAKFDYMSGLAKDMGFTPDPEALDMLEQANRNLSRHMRQELGALVGKRMACDRMDGALLHLFLRGAEDDTAEEFLARFRAEDPVSLLASYAGMIYWSSEVDWLGGRSFEEACGSRDLLYRLVAERPLEDREDHERLLEHIRYPEEFKSRSVQLLEAYLDYGFQPARGRLRELGELGAMRYDAIFREQPEAAFERYAKMSAEVLTKPARVHVSYVCQIRYDLYHASGESLPNWLVLGYFNETQSSMKQEKDDVEKFLKVVSDKRRMDIIDLLKIEKRYAGELAQLLELTPSAINYHANLLIDLDLIRITREDGRIYYELNAERLSSLLDQTKRVLLQ